MARRSSKDVVLCGLNSSYAAEVVETSARLDWTIVAGILMDIPGWSLRGVQTILRHDEVSDLLTELPVLLSLINPQPRRDAVDWARKRGFKDFPQVIDPLAHVSPSAYVEKGVSIGAGSTIGAAVELDPFVLVNRHASIGHHSVLEEFVTVGPGVSIASNCIVRQGVMIGTGAVLAPSVEIGAKATIGAGAVVLRSVPPGVTVIGNPARIAKGDRAEIEASSAGNQ